LSLPIAEKDSLSLQTQSFSKRLAITLKVTSVHGNIVVDKQIFRGAGIAIISCL
jgi:hypothetical protein